jgi:hypothetical protein
MYTVRLVDITVQCSRSTPAALIDTPNPAPVHVLGPSLRKGAGSQPEPDPCSLRRQWPGLAAERRQIPRGCEVLGHREPKNAAQHLPGRLVEHSRPLSFDFFVSLAGGIHLTHLSFERHRSHAVGFVVIEALGGVQGDEGEPKSFGPGCC